MVRGKLLSILGEVEQGLGNIYTYIKERRSSQLFDQVMVINLRDLVDNFRSLASTKEDESKKKVR